MQKAKGPRLGKRKIMVYPEFPPTQSYILSKQTQDTRRLNHVFEHA